MTEAGRGQTAGDGRGQAAGDGRGQAAGDGRGQTTGGGHTAGDGRRQAAGGGQTAGDRWKRHIVRQLKHRDLNQHDMFQDLICFYTRLLQKTCLTKGILSCSIRQPSGDSSVSSLLLQNNQLKKTTGELAFQVVELQQQIQTREEELKDQQARLGGEERRLAGAFDAHQELQGRVERLQEENRVMKVEYDALLERQRRAETSLRDEKLREGHLLEDVIHLKQQAAARMNSRNERRSRAREANLRKELQTAARSKVIIDSSSSAPSSRSTSPKTSSTERGHARLFRSASATSPRILKSIKDLFEKRRGHSVCSLEEDQFCPVGICLSARVPVRALQVLEAHEQGINAVRFSCSSDLLATGGTDRVIKLWEVRAGSLTHRATLDGSTEGITCIEFDPKGLRILAASYDKSALLWRLDDSVPKFHPSVSHLSVSPVCVSPVCLCLTCLSLSHLSVCVSPVLVSSICLSPVCLTCLCLTCLSHLSVSHLSVSPVLVSSICISPVCLTCLCLTCLSFIHLYLTCLSMSHLSVSHVCLTCLCLTCLSHLCQLTLTGHSRKVTAARFSGLHQVVTGSADRTIRLWDLQRAACVQVVEMASYCSDLVCSENSIISGHYDSKIRVWDTRTVSCIQELPAQGRVTSLDISSDHRQLLSCCRDDCLQLVDLRRWSNDRMCFRADGFKCGSDSTKAVISPDGCFLAAGSADGVVYIWNVTNGNLETRLPDKHSSSISAVSWSLSGQYVVSVDKSRRAVLWSDI